MKKTDFLSIMLLIVLSIAAFADIIGIPAAILVTLLFVGGTFLPFLLLCLLYGRIKGVRLSLLSRISKGVLDDTVLKNIEVDTETIKDDSPIVQMNLEYFGSESTLLRNIIKKEIENQGENVRKLTTAKIDRKRNIVVLMFGLLTFICVLMYFFNIELKTCLIYEGITLLLYIFMLKRFSIVNVISRRAKKNPDEDIAQMVTEVKMNKKQVTFPVSIKTGILVLTAIVIPMIIFANPKLLYFNYKDGCAVMRYTKGLLKQSDTVVIPDTHNGKNVLAIGESSFENTSIKNVTLPQNLESIKSKAFFNCQNLESIHIPQNVTEIRASAFENCSNLKEVSLPNGIVDIRASAFKNDTKLVGIELPESLEYLGASAFSHCSSLREITIPSKIIEINGQTFEYCTSLRKINLHDDIISIHGENFVGCVNLDNVILPSKLTEIRGNTFENCSSLSSIVIPEGVTRIGGHAFYGCSSLSSVTVPTTVVEIGSSAFRRCYSLSTIKVPRNAIINERAFKESPTSVKYY